MLGWNLFQIPTGPHSTMRRTSQWQERQGRTLFFILRSSIHSMLHWTFSHNELWWQNSSGSLSNHLSSKHGFSGVPHWGGGYLCFFQVFNQIILNCNWFYNQTTLCCHCFHWFNLILSQLWSLWVWGGEQHGRWRMILWRIMFTQLCI